MITSFQYPLDKIALESFKIANPVHKVCRMGSVIKVLTGADIPVEAVATCDELQIRLALNILGLRPAVEAYVSSADQFVKDWWEKATVFKIDNPMLLSAASVLNKVNDLPTLFALAKQQPTAR